MSTGLSWTSRRSLPALSNGNDLDRDGRRSAASSESGRAKYLPDPCVLASLAPRAPGHPHHMGIAAGFTLFATALAAATPAAPPCPQAHRCHHVLHVGPTGSDTGHASWDSKEVFRPGPIAIGINYSPKLPTDAGVRIEPIGDCGIHFVLPARFTGFATRCGKGK